MSGENREFPQTEWSLIIKQSEEQAEGSLGNRNLARSVRSGF
jgi:hypothetical protein